MDIEKAAFGLIEQIYAAALAPEKWQQVMSGVVETIGVNSALLREVNYTKGKVGLYQTYGFDPAYTKAYREHLVRLDYLLQQKRRYCLGLTLARQHDYYLLFALQRTQQQGDFTLHDLPLLHLLASHITRAMAIRRLQLVTTEQRWALSALGKLTVGVLFFEAIFHLNIL